MSVAAGGITKMEKKNSKHEKKNYKDFFGPRG